MSFVLEDGTAPDGANSYLSVDDANTYCSDRGLTFAASPTTLGEEALVRATAALDAMYRGRFPGYRTNGRSQSLEWPRTAAYDAEWNPIDNDEIPVEVKNAVAEMAVRELEAPGSMMPDLERGGQVRRLKAGSVEVEYGSNSTATTTFQLIDGIMAPLLGAGTASFVGYAIRG